MVNITFGEQVKIILSRRGMTIKQLAELVEAHTGKPMSRQNMTQRLGRDNFQEQDMRMIAEILGCKFQLNILDADEDETVIEADSLEREITVGELMEDQPEEPAKEVALAEPKMEKESAQPVTREREILKKGVSGYFKKSEKTEKEKEEVVGDINPYTGKEYKSNSVRIHPKRIGYVQVYDQEKHQWTDMTEWAFLGYQERKKVAQGKDYQPPIYLD